MIAIGILSTVIFVSALKELGANVDFYIPNRLDEGYGLSRKFIENAEKDGIDFIITCDNGISGKSAVELAIEKNIDILITDHHIPGSETPENTLIIDPKYNQDSFPDISGGYVSFKVIKPLLIEARKFYLLKDLAVLAAITTVSDLMPLIGENRILIKSAFNYIEKLKVENRWTGIALKMISALGGRFFLKDQNKLPSVQLFSFYISPVINAISRVNEDPSKLVNDIIDSREYRHYISQDYIQLNNLRKDRTEEIFRSLEDDINNVRVSLIKPEEFDYSIVGFFGLLANKAVNNECKPALIGSDLGDIYRFSGRSIPGYSLYDAIERIKIKYPELEISGGGHSLALGINLKKTEHSLEVLRKALDEDFIENSKIIEPSNYLLEDETIDSIVDACQEFGIFGSGFREPELVYTGIITDVEEFSYTVNNEYTFKSFSREDPSLKGCKITLYFNIYTDELTGPYFKISKIIKED